MAEHGNIREVKRELTEIYRELEQGQREIEQGLATTTRANDLVKLAKQAEELQSKVDQYDEISKGATKGRELQTRTMPADRSSEERKSLTTTPGHLFVASDAFRTYRANGKQGWSGKVDIKDVRNGYARLHGDEAELFRVKAYDPATLSDLGTDAIIQPQIDPEVVRFEEPEILTIRSVLNVLPTTSDSIRFVRHTETGRAATSQWDSEADPPQARGGLKPYLTITAAADTVTVETIAVLSKVTEQDIDDAPRLIGMINGEMRLDVRVEEERQLLWGDGDEGEIEGIFEQGVEAYEFDRAVGGDTILDTIRRMRTNLRKRRVIPNALLIDPLDWEGAELTKSSADEHYIWAIVTDLRGPRVWSVRVIESDAMTNPADDSRRMVMLDGIRGATIYDRHDVRLAVGYVDDDFARNLRTLRAEERIALAVKRPFAFEWVETAAAES
jgi:HK97 family phage major capsid protein